MKILFLVPSMAFGGAERVISILSNQWCKQHTVIIVSIDNDKRCAYALDKGVILDFIPAYGFNSFSKIKMTLSTVKQTIEKYNPNVVLSFMSHTAMFAALTTKIPLIYSERNDPNNNIVGWKSKLFQIIALKSAKAVVFQTRGARDYYNKNIKKKSEIILNPIDPHILPKERHTGERRKEIVNVGRLAPQKNQELLIRAFSKIKDQYSDYTLIIYGEGNQREFLEDIVKKEGHRDKVLMPGSCKDVLQRIDGASVFAFSSDYEGLPNALMEAMALGLPCVSTDCSPGGAREFIKNYENGVLVPCGDVDAFADALSSVLSNKENAERLGKNAQTILERTSIEKISDEWMSVILSVVKGNDI